MSCGGIRDFSGGKVGFVRMELWAGGLQNLSMRTEIGAYMSYKGLKIEKNGEQIGSVERNGGQIRPVKS